MKFKTVRELFYFTQKERGGIIALLCLIFILFSVNIAFPYLYKVKTPDISKWENEVSQYLGSRKDTAQLIGKKDFAQFNPNDVTLNELEVMGLPAKVTSNWIRYLERGGRFKAKADVKKIYGMTAVLFNRLERFILLPSDVTSGTQLTKTGSKNNDGVVQKITTNEAIVTDIKSIEINKADSTELENLPGIGPVLAMRIIHYRKILGGYYSIAQLHEVYGLREEHFAMASPYLIVDPEQVSRFNINFALISELGRHPYIGFKTARKIVKLRDERGKFSSTEDLTGVVTGDSLTRLIPYLTFNVKE